MTASPTFSIIIPTYNRAHLIGKTIKSVLAQTFADYEVIVVDDGSTDDTEKVIHSFKDDRLRYLCTDNKERGAARNTGMDAAKGRYLTFLDSDDLFYSEHLSKAMAHVETGKRAFWCPYEQIDQEGQVVKAHTDSGREIIHDLIHKGNILSCHGVFLEADAVRHLRFVEDRRLAGSEDMEFWLRLSSRLAIHKAKEVTNALVHHKGRSVFNFDDTSVLIKRKELMLDYLLADGVFMEAFGHKMNVIRARAFSYIALHAAMNEKNENKVARRYLMKSLREEPGSILSKRCLSILRHLL